MVMISSFIVGSYAPSFTSKITVPDSRTSTVCHCPFGIFRPKQGPLGLITKTSVTTPSSL